jgi:putative resolvase
MLNYMEIDKLVTRKEVLKTIKVHYHTLMAMVKRGELEAVELGNKKLYNLDKYLRTHGIVATTQQRKICYCRVSSQKQSEDLERQKKVMKELYPNHELISDIGSGLNEKRKGYLKILDCAIKGELGELVIAYKDRLCRFGYDTVEYIIKKYSKGKIIILNKSEEKTPTDELTKDVLSIMNVYVAKVNGLRKYKNLMKKEIEVNEKK